METIIKPLVYGMRLLLIESEHAFGDEIELSVYDAESAMLHGNEKCIIDNLFEPRNMDSGWTSYCLYTLMSGYRTHHDWRRTTWEKRIYEMLEEYMKFEVITWWNLDVPDDWKNHDDYDCINRWFYVYVNDTEKLRKWLKEV